MNHLIKSVAAALSLFFVVVSALDRESPSIVFWFNRLLLLLFLLQILYDFSCNELKGIVDSWGRNQVRKIEPVLLKNLARYGYDIHDPTPEELAPFKAAQKGVPDRVAKEMGPEGVALLEAIRKTF